MEDIADILTDRGLETRATARRTAGPVSSSKISSMLRDPYYVGDIVYKGETFEGRHTAIIDRDLFVRVQWRLEASGRAGERKRVYPHYLKGTLWCGECYTVRGLVDKRMLIQRSIGKLGGEYFYFFCRGRQEGICDSRHLPFDLVEDEFIEHYRTVKLNPDFIEWVHGQIDDALKDQAGSQRQLREQIQGQIARLQTRADNLIDLVADGGLAGSKAREKITEIERERAGLKARLGTIEDDLSIGAEFIKGWLELLRDPYELYRNASNDMRRDLNQAIFKRIFVLDQDRAESELQEPVRLLLEAQAEWAALFGVGFDLETNENDAEASSSGKSTEGHWRKPVDLALGSSKQSLVHLLQVYSNPPPGVVIPQELIFRSPTRERQQDARTTPRRARQLRTDEAKRISARYLAVRNIRTVAREFQVSRSTVARILTAHGIDASRRMTEAQIAVAVKLYEQGLSSGAVGRRLGFDNHTILRALRGRNVEIRTAINDSRKSPSSVKPLDA